MLRRHPSYKCTWELDALPSLQRSLPSSLWTCRLAHLYISGHEKQCSPMCSTQ